ncbi:MAG: sulfoxide reductase heme-binding subunit YedZ [Gammaproteobacteria bacterium]|nr:sulfoxide reductase heme-binding subunit YedZ [Gammaproteobacteria bacterium]MDH5728166.1 sulfoxide reductase heme-binding subunit YedZ [Gammaproteobacteria bacterium]
MRNIVYWKLLLFALSLLPAVALVWMALQNQLGANPVEKLIHETGEWGLRFLLLTLAITPLRKKFSWNVLLKFRRMLGLFAFFYAFTHFAIYLSLEHFFDWQEILKDIAKRPYVTVGFVGIVILTVLAITSFNGIRRRLGKRWVVLHRSVYVAASCAVFHYLWLVKADILEPVIYAVIWLVLLAVRRQAKPTQQQSTLQARSQQV